MNENFSGLDGDARFDWETRRCCPALQVDGGGDDDDWIDLFPFQSSFGFLWSKSRRLSP